MLLPTKMDPGESQLFQIIYWSDSHNFGAECLPAIQDILLISREKNAKMQLTGALMFSNGRFAQVLEGPRIAVNAVYSSIKRDTRHRNIVTASEKSIRSRDFPEWTMAFVGKESLPDLLLKPSAPDDYEDFSPSGMAPFYPNGATPCYK